MLALFNLFDNTSRANDYEIFVGEYSCTNTGGDSFRFPEIQCSVAEAVFLIGLERNSDVVKMASYAPLLAQYGLPHQFMVRFTISKRFGAETIGINVSSLI